MTPGEMEMLALEAACGPGGGVSAAEIHGATVGIAVADVSRFELQDLLDTLGADALSTGDAVDRFVREAVAALRAEDLSFALLLPDDQEPMPCRLTALAEWSQSFLAGLVAGMARRGVSMEDLPEEAREIVRDFSAIAGMETEQEEAGEDDEADFMELEEYMKVGVILIMSLMNDDGSRPEE